MELDNDDGNGSSSASTFVTLEKLQDGAVLDVAASLDNTPALSLLPPPQQQRDGLLHSAGGESPSHTEPLVILSAAQAAEPNLTVDSNNVMILLPFRRNNDDETKPPAAESSSSSSSQRRSSSQDGMVQDNNDPNGDPKKEGTTRRTRTLPKAVETGCGQLEGQRKRAVEYSSSDSAAADDESFLDYFKSRVSRKKLAKEVAFLSSQQQQRQSLEGSSNDSFHEGRDDKGRRQKANDVVATTDSMPIRTVAIMKVRRRRREKDNNKNENDNDNDEDNKDTAQRSSNDSVPSRKSIVPKKLPLTCPHCSTSFAVHSALQYHVNHFVCRRRELRKATRSRRGSRNTSTARASFAEGAATNLDEAAADDNNNEDDRNSDTVEEEEDDDDNRDSDVDDDHRSLSELTFHKKEKPQPKQQPLVCPHCSKNFAVQSGLQYHVNHFVCRPKLRRFEGSPVQKKRGRPKKSAVTSSRNAARKRLIVNKNEVDADNVGTKENDDDKSNDSKDAVDVEEKITTKPEKRQPLVCSHCSKIFAVQSSLQYHVNNFVCRPMDRLEGSPVHKKRGRPKKSNQSASTSCQKRASQRREADNEDNIMDSNSAEDNGEDNDSTVESVELTTKKKTIQPKTEALACPHCSKIFSVHWRLQHHVDKFVCRPALRLEGSTVQTKGLPRKPDTSVPITLLLETASKSRKGKTASQAREKAVKGDDTESDCMEMDDDDASKDADDDSEAKAKPRKSRKLKKEPDACPYCSKIFSVRSRLKYHLDKFVCRPTLRLEGLSVPTSGEIKKSGESIPGSFRVSASKARKVVNENGTDSDSVEGDDDSKIIDEDKSNDGVHDDYDSVESKPNKKRKLKKEPLVCPHCNKIFSIQWGLQYHVDNFVCRPATRPGGPKSKGRPKSSEKVGIKEYKRIRGAVNDRTCPNCKRVFTSVWGCEYHRDKRVCENPQKTSSKPFDTVLPGHRFATKYGVVEVINDDRAIPTAELADDFKQRLKVFYSSHTKRQVQMKKQLSNAAVASRARRTLLRQMFEAGGVTQQSLEEAYRGVNTIRDSDKRAARTPQPPRPIMEDPSAPRESYPDRIVECIIVPDQRPRVVGDDDANLMEGLPSAQSRGGKAIRIYIQRRFLMNMYNEENTRYHCSHCWQCFLSKPGLKYHTDSEACLKKAEKDAAAAKDNLQSIEDRAEELVALMRAQQEVNTISSCRVPDEPREGFRNSSGRFNGPRVERRPAAESSDQAMPVIPAKTTEMEVCAKSTENAVCVITTKAEEELDTCDNLIAPDEVIANLEVELYLFHGKMIGPMYPEVWKSLGYQKPKKKQSKKTKRNPNLPQKKRRKRNGEAEAEAVETVQPDLEPPLDFMERTAPEPPIVDTRALVKEVDAGRYPTIHRYVGEHDAICIICKEAVSPIPLLVGQQNLIPCDFCKHAVHFSCISTIFTLKDPEPEDDFMCHYCIRRIATRRSRAERRRLEKLNPDVPVTLKKDKDAEKIRDMISLTKGTVVDREFECVAAQARRVEDLSELLRDAQRRLAVSMEVAAMNQTRRALMEAMYEDDDTNAFG